MSNFKKSKSESERISDSKIIERYYRIPIIVEKDKKCKIKDIDIYNDMTLGQFMYVIRKRIKLDSTEAL